MKVTSSRAKVRSFHGSVWGGLPLNHRSHSSTAIDRCDRLQRFLFLVTNAAPLPRSFPCAFATQSTKLFSGYSVLVAVSRRNGSRLGILSSSGKTTAVLVLEANRHTARRNGCSGAGRAPPARSVDGRRYRPRRWPVVDSASDRRCWGFRSRSETHRCAGRRTLPPRPRSVGA